MGLTVDAVKNVLAELLLLDGAAALQHDLLAATAAFVIPYSIKMFSEAYPCHILTTPLWYSKAKFIADAPLLRRFT